MGQKRFRMPRCLLDASVLMFDFEMTMTSITKVLRIELYNNNTNHARGTREQAGRQAGRQAGSEGEGVWITRREGMAGLTG